MKEITADNSKLLPAPNSSNEVPRPTVTITSVRDASTSLFYNAIPNFYLSAPSEKDTYVKVSVGGSSSSCQNNVDCSYVTDDALTPTLTTVALDDAND